MKHLSFDFNNMFSFSVGQEHGISDVDLKTIMPLVRKSHEHLQSILNDTESRIALSLEWSQLAFQDRQLIKQIQKTGDEVAAKYDNVCRWYRRFVSRYQSGAGRSVPGVL
jgi:hypothetical protein